MLKYVSIGRRYNDTTVAMVSLSGKKNLFVGVFHSFPKLVQKYLLVISSILSKYWMITVVAAPSTSAKD